MLSAASLAEEGTWKGDSCWNKKWRDERRGRGLGRGLRCRRGYTGAAEGLLEGEAAGSQQMAVGGGS